MNRSARILLIFICASATALLALLAMGFLQKPDTENRLFVQSVNLALRQTADRLLDLAGNSTATIPPVKQISENEYLLLLQSNFDYDSLPGFLQAAFSQYGIADNYYVTVTGCDAFDLILGYAKEDLQSGEQPCGGREQIAACYNISVLFPDKLEQTAIPSGLWASGILALGLLLFSGFYFYKHRPAEMSGASDPAAFIQFGNSRFDQANLSLHTGNQQQNLTFREAKLLHFFLQNKNQVLPREAILAAVWEDEGIIVGRSLDVFVSRLRKILQADAAVTIATVHGLGYRLVVD